MKPAARQQAASTVTDEPKKREKPYTEADIQRVWGTTVALSQLGPMLTSLLNVAMPVMEGDGVLTVRVSSQMEADVLAKALPTLQRHLCDALENDGISISARVCEMELPKNLWTDDRVLQEILDEHPGVKHLIEKFKLRRT